MTEREILESAEGFARLLAELVDELERSGGQRRRELAAAVIARLALDAARLPLPGVPPRGDALH